LDNETEMSVLLCNRIRYCYANFNEWDSC